MFSYNSIPEKEKEEKVKPTQLNVDFTSPTYFLKPWYCTPTRRNSTNEHSNINLMPQNGANAIAFKDIINFTVLPCPIKFRQIYT